MQSAWAAASGDGWTPNGWDWRRRQCAASGVGLSGVGQCRLLVFNFCSPAGASHAVLPSRQSKAEAAHWLLTRSSTSATFIQATGAMRDNQATVHMSLIDCDLHNVVPSIQTLFPYLSEHWREYVSQSASNGAPDTAYPASMPTSAWPSTRPANGVRRVRASTYCGRTCWTPWQ